MKILKVFGQDCLFAVIRVGTNVLEINHILHTFVAFVCVCDYYYNFFFLLSATALATDWFPTTTSLAPIFLSLSIVRACARSITATDFVSSTGRPSPSHQADTRSYYHWNITLYNPLTPPSFLHSWLATFGCWVLCPFSPHRCCQRPSIPPSITFFQRRHRTPLVISRPVGRRPLSNNFDTGLVLKPSPYTMSGKVLLTEDPAYKALADHFRCAGSSLNIKNLFANDAGRFDKFRWETNILDLGGFSAFRNVDLWRRDGQRSLSLAKTDQRCRFSVGFLLEICYPRSHFVICYFAYLVLYSRILFVHVPCTNSNRH